MGLSNRARTMLLSLAKRGDSVAAGFPSAAAGVEDVVVVTTPAAKGTTNIAAALAANAAGPFVIAASPDVPRNLRVVFAASWDGGNVVVTGTDQFGGAVTETFTSAAGTTVVGVKIFKTVTGATKSATGVTANAASIGTGDKLAFGNKKLASPFVDVRLATGAGDAATVDQTYSAFTPTTLADGAKTYTCLIRT